MVPYTCPACGAGNVSLKSQKGNTFGHKQIVKVVLEHDILIPTCNTCEEMFLDGKTTQLLDEALEPSFRKIMNQKENWAIATLRAKNIDLKRLNRIFGSGLSSVKTSLLMLLASDPSRIMELQKLWNKDE